MDRHTLRKALPYLLPSAAGTAVFYAAPFLVMLVYALSAGSVPEVLSGHALAAGARSTAVFLSCGIGASVLLGLCIALALPPRTAAMKLTLLLPAYAAILLSREAAGEYVPALPEKTRIVIHYDTGFGNRLTIRGNTSPLRWDFGQRCENKNADTWVFETERPKDGELRCKVLLNDAVWERGEDHRAAVGRETHVFPSFW